MYAEKTLTHFGTEKSEFIVNLRGKNNSEFLYHKYISKAIFPLSYLKKLLSTGISLKPAFL